MLARVLVEEIFESIKLSVVVCKKYAHEGKLKASSLLCSVVPCCLAQFKASINQALFDLRVKLLLTSRVSLCPTDLFNMKSYLIWYRNPEKCFLWKDSFRTRL